MPGERVFLSRVISWPPRYDVASIRGELGEKQQVGCPRKPRVIQGRGETYGQWGAGILWLQGFIAVGRVFA